MVRCSSIVRRRPATSRTSSGEPAHSRAARSRISTVERGRDGGGRRRVGRRQEHAAAPARRAGSRRRRARSHVGGRRSADAERRRRSWSSATGTSASSSSSTTCCRSSRALENVGDADAHRAAAARRGDGSARASCWRASGSAERARRTGRACCRAASSSASPWRGRSSCGPALLLADEPTGDLDETTAEALHELLREMHAEHGLTSVIATHNPRLAAACDRVLRLEGGQLRPA